MNTFPTTISHQIYSNFHLIFWSTFHLCLVISVIHELAVLLRIHSNGVKHFPVAKWKWKASGNIKLENVSFHFDQNIFFFLPLCYTFCVLFLFGFCFPLAFSFFSLIIWYNHILNNEMYWHWRISHHLSFCYTFWVVTIRTVCVCACVFACVLLSLIPKGGKHFGFILNEKQVEMRKKATIQQQNRKSREVTAIAIATTATTTAAAITTATATNNIRDKKKQRIKNTWIWECWLNDDDDGKKTKKKERKEMNEYKKRRRNEIENVCFELEHKNNIRLHKKNGKRWKRKK